MAERYIVWRTPDFHLVGCDPLELESLVFFQLSERRLAPYDTLANGDTLYLREEVEHRHCLVWELRAQGVLAEPYASHLDVFRTIQRTYGVNPEDLNLGEYVFGRNQVGFLLAWAMDVIAPLDIALPEPKLGALGHRTGLVAFSTLPDDYRVQLNPLLPPPGRPAIVEAQVSLSAEPRTTPETDRRYIPRLLRRRVLERDGFACRSCGKTRPEVSLHIDHVRPFSLGGGSVEQNLQVLCASCNLRKGNKVFGPVPAPTWNPGVQRQTQQRIYELRSQVSGGDEAARAAALELVRLDEAMPDIETEEMLRLASDSMEPTVSFQAKLWLGEMLSDDEPQAIALLEEVHDSKVLPFSAEAGVELGLALYESDPKRAKGLFEEALASPDPDDVAAAASALVVGYDEEISDAAVWESSLQASDARTRAFAAISLAAIYNEQDRADDGVDHLLRIALASPDERVAELALGWLHGDSEDG